MKTKSKSENAENAEIRRYHEEEFQNELSNEYYMDWLSDNIANLRHEFCAEHEDEFNDYCKKQFNLWGNK
jgi:hypothetical protein